MSTEYLGKSCRTVGWVPRQGAVEVKVQQSCNAEVLRPYSYEYLTSGAHDVIAITSLPKNDLCTEELRDIDRAKSLDEASLTHKKARFCCLFF